jgi:hypothetical protein
MSSLSIKEQIAQLERQRAEELRRISDLYSRTQRDVARSVSPTRFVKKHLVAMLAVAAVVGMVLAPAPRRSKRKRHGKSDREERSSFLARVMRMAMKWAPGVDKFVPDALKSKLHQAQAAAGGAAPRPDQAEHENAQADSECCHFGPEPAVHEGKAAAGGAAKRAGPDGLINEIARSVLTTFLARADIKGCAQRIMEQVKAGLRNPRRARTVDTTAGATIGVGDVGTVKEDETL